jgi:hypothetical protein
MRLHIGAAMPVKGGRPVIAGVEVFEGRGEGGRLRHVYRVGLIERVTPYGIEAARDAVLAFMVSAIQHRPCVVVDTGHPAGLALHQALKTVMPPILHRPHSYPGAGVRPLLFAEFLKAYSEGRVEFEPGLRYRPDLDKALVFYQGGGVQRHGVELESEDEAMVIALGLAMTWPMHGARARSLAEAAASPEKSDPASTAPKDPAEPSKLHVRKR